MSSSTSAWPNRWCRSRRGPVGVGLLRHTVEDFRVEELCEPEFDDGGEHLYLQVEKVGLTTPMAQDRLARAFGTSRMDVAYAGLKDRRSVAIQWFSVHTKRQEPKESMEGIRILQSGRCLRKLRRGQHSGNRFQLTIRNVGGLDSDFTAKFGTKPFPNYFGPQRFGREGGNIEASLAWVKTGQPRVGRLARSIYISSLRSLVFNDVLGRRVGEQCWQSPEEGEVLEDGWPTGPLWGRGRPATDGRPRKWEVEAANSYPEAVEALEWVGLAQERRALAALPRDVDVDSCGPSLHVRFSLAPGTYATSAMREWLELEEARG